MLRQKLLEKTDPSGSSFRVRGEEIQRIEGFSDAVFGFTVTLLVVSLEVPKTFGELLDTMHDFFAFGVGFALLVSIWYWQYLFFRRFNLRDNFTIVLNAILLFVVLFYAYPLKFLWKLVFDNILSYPIPEDTVTASQETFIMVIYGAGFIAVNGVLALLYWHAYRQREALELSAVEEFDTITVTQNYLLNVLVGVISIFISLTTNSIALAGYSYFLIPIVIGIYRGYRGRLRRKTFPDLSATAGLEAGAETPVVISEPAVVAVKEEKVPAKEDK